MEDSIKIVTVTGPVVTVPMDTSSCMFINHYGRSAIGTSQPRAMFVIRNVKTEIMFECP